MFKKVAIPTLLLAAAVGGPIAYFSGTDYWQTAPDEQRSSQGPTAASGPVPTTSLGALTAEAVPSEASGTAIEGPATGDLGEIFRFDVSTGWVLRKWPRVSTGLAQLSLQGYRVALVTGTDEADLAGSLTYYFNARQKVQRITFRGTTGDPRKLIRLLAARHKFTRRLTNNPGLFIYEVSSPDGRPKSLLKIQSARVVKANDPYRRFDVELTIERPS